MVTGGNSRQSAPDGLETVRGPTLQETLQKVRVRFGEEARVVESRTVEVAQSGKLGKEKMVEVVVAPEESESRLAARSLDESPARPAAGRREVAGGLVDEVERIEKLVQNLLAKRDPGATAAAELQDYPLAAGLIAAGVSLDAVRRLAGSFALDANAERDLPAALAHLRSVIRIGQGGWDDFGGCHVFLGDSGAGKSDIVLAAAAQLQQAGRQVLVLNVLPRHGGEVRRLQLEAAQYNYDAAILQAPEQLERSVQHLSKYDVVLVDTPSLFGSAFAAAGDLQRFIAQNEGFHRHLAVPLDLDFREGGELWEAARLWNADWIAVTRLDRVSGRGKVLDLLERLPLPLSLVVAGQWPEKALQVASTVDWVELILGKQSGRLAATAIG